MTKKPDTLHSHQRAVKCVALAPDGRRALSAGLDGTVLLWDLEDLKPRQQFGPFEGPMKAVTFDPSGKELICATGLQLYVVKLATGKTIRRFRQGIAFARSVAFSGDGSRALNRSGPPCAGANSGHVAVWDTRTGKKLTTFVGNTSRGNRMVTCRDGSLVATEHPDEIWLWDGTTGYCQEILSPAPQGTPRSAALPLDVSALAMSPGGEFVAAASAGRIYLWNSATGALDHRFSAHGRTVIALAFSGDGRRLLSALRSRPHGHRAGIFGRRSASALGLREWRGP